MNISGYGVANNYSGYDALSKKAKTPTAFLAIPAEKPKTESKNNNATNGYDPFKDMAKTGSVSLPSGVYTKTEPTRSDEEILKDITELAKKHAEQGTFHSRDNEYLSLMKEYVSSVSPDRESILENTVSEINEKIKISNSQENEEEKEYFDAIGKFLQMLKNMEKGENKAISDSDETASNSSGQITYNMYGATYEAYAEDGKVKDAIIHDSSGETVMYFDNRNSTGQLSITQAWTERECSRETEIMEVYNEVYKSTSSTKGFVSGNAFDAVG